MGVLGLWEVLESVGHPIKVEGLEGKVLGVDANIWLYKFIRGFREKDNATSIDGHKLGLFNRISKLLYYRIKPVFVFDGPAPVLKRRTLERRQNTRNKQLTRAQDAAMRILATQLKSQYPNADIDHLKITLPNLQSNNLVAAEKLTDEDRELFYLPETGKLKNSDDEESDSDQSRDNDPVQFMSAKVDIHSRDFEQLPAETRYEILQDIKESQRKIRNHQNLPDDANSFSNLQLQRLQSRRKVQEKIEKAEKEICTNYTGELADGSSIRAFRVQSDATARILYRNNTYDPKALDNLKGESTQNESVVLKSEFPDADAGGPRETKLSSPVNNLVTEKKLSDVARELFCVPDVGIIESSDEEDSDEQDSDPVHPCDDSDVQFLSAKKDGHSSRTQAQLFTDKSELPDADADGPGSQTVDLSPPTISPQSPDQNAQRVTNRATNEEVQDARELLREKLTGEDRDLFHPNETCELESSDEEDGDSVHPCDDSDVQFLSARRDGHPSGPRAQPLADISCEILEDIRAPHSKICDSDTPDEGASPNAAVLPNSHEEVEGAEEATRGTGHDDQRAATNGPCERAAPAPASSAQLDATASVGYRSSNSSTNELEPPNGAESGSVQQCYESSQWDSQTTVRASSQTVGPSAATISYHAPDWDAQRATNRVTNKVVQDAKELLRLFGIPYLDAAGEAEAQCAKLEELKLTEGTITDDSDIWLFGSHNVFRYFFSDDKYVMQYKMTDIEFHVRLTRENLACFAMLVGSDYTDGIMNVGPVTALEILSEFPGDGLEPLVKFRDWHREALRDPKAIGDKKRKKLLKFRLPDEFPSRAVFEGYMRPLADTSAESFAWGTPELDELRDYAHRNFGWDPKKVDEKLLPVLKRLNEKKLQRTIDTFFFKTQANREPETFRSKRVNQALNKIAKRRGRPPKAEAAPVPEVVNLSEDDSD